MKTRLIALVMVAVIGGHDACFAGSGSGNDTSDWAVPDLWRRDRTVHRSLDF
jgi:hypothetical protein